MSDTVEIGGGEPLCLGVTHRFPHNTLREGDSIGCYCGSMQATLFDGAVRCTVTSDALRDLPLISNGDAHPNGVRNLVQWLFKGTPPS